MHQGNANLNYNQIATLYPPEWLIAKQLSVGEGVEQQEISYAGGGCTNWCKKSEKLFDSIY